MFNDSDNRQEKVSSLNVDWVEKYEKLRKLSEDLKQTLWEVKKEMQHHKDFGTALFWENDLIEKIDNVIGYYISEVN